MVAKSRNTRVFFEPIAVLAMLAALALVLAHGQPAHAATITVNSAADVIADDGACTLREAITAANTDTASGATLGECAAGSGADTITVPAGIYTLSIAGTNEDANASGDLDITSHLTINGAGAAMTIIDGGALDRAVHITGGTVHIAGVTIQNGSAGGVGSQGGGIYNGGTLTLNNSTITGNNTSTGAGGGIGNSGTLTINSSSFSGNSATGGTGGGIVNVGGTATVTNATISANSAGAGGGIANFGGTLTLNSSTVSGNSAGAFGGGGILNFGGGTLTLTSSTVSGNSAPAGGGGGGGIRNEGGTATLNNSTVSGNSAVGFRAAGGGIYNNGTMTLNSIAVVGNTAVFSGSGGGIYNDGTATLKNTIVANNGSDDCGGAFISAGHNLIEAVPPYCALIGDTTGNIIGSDPLLGPLADNGGPTQTHALLPGSPAIDAGLPTTDPDCSGGDDFDQRGVPRPQGAACDIGAFELVQVISVQIDIKPGSDPNCVNAGSEGVIPVAILTTDTFDASTVDPLTVMLEGGVVRLRGKGGAGSLEDVDGDGDLDLVVQITDWTLTQGQTEAVLTGRTFDGTQIRGTDSICVLPR